MPLRELIQMLIHKLEVGAGSRYLRIVALAMGVVALAFVYDLRAYRNLAAPEAMDAAQLARNISQGKGYTTLLIRPFSLYLVQNHNEAKSPFALTNAAFDFAQIKTAHPDLANPPVYPLLLAGLMKALPFDYKVNLKKPFWTNNGKFWRYQPDFFIAIFNEVLLLVVVVLTFFLAKKLFDSNVAWLSAILTLGCELLWRFSSSGLSTMLLLAVFLGLTLFLLEIERGARESQPRAGWLLGLAAAAGFLTGIGALTRYAFGWTIIPVAMFLLMFGGSKRLWHMLVALAAFALVLTPWIIRNETVSGTAFGTAGYAVIEGTFVFPGFQLERSIHPELTLAMRLTPYVQKLFGNMRGILTGDLLKTGATWAGVLFFAGLFLGFRSTGARRVRHRIEALDPPGDLDRLESHPAHAGLLEREVDDRAELVVVEPLLERDDQRGRDPVLVEVLERPVADLDQVGAAHRLLGRGVERVELEVHLEARHVPGEPPRELGVIGDPHAVGVDHQVLDRPLARQVEDLEELGVDRRLAAGDLHDVRPSLVPHDAVQHERDLLERPMR